MKFNLYLVLYVTKDCLRYWDVGHIFSNLVLDHWKAVKQVLQHLQRINNFMLTYQRSNQLEINGYTDSDFTRYQDSINFTMGYIYMLVGSVVSSKNVK